ncbi:MAG: hypothetical protein DMF19_04935 [Verrucomicrobia bacterium]|nr:MAG: hypothetical protein DMF19_04935 [Verrucomicrobiota bacterium]
MNQDRMTREAILSEIRRTAQENGGVALGKKRFLDATGIAESDWSGRYWTRWSDAVAEAGFVVQSMNPRLPDVDVIEAAAAIVRSLGHFPTAAEIRLAASSNPDMPSHNTFRRFGGLGGLREALVRFAQERADNELLSKLGAAASIESLSGEAEREPAELQEGFVYLSKAGRRYKIGRASSVERRHRELAIQLPEPAEVIHRIRTDDPAGIEAYWHKRFADRRLNGEWFALSASDVKVFRRRPRM